jgi:hypothetical protein
MTIKLTVELDAQEAVTLYRFLRRVGAREIEYVLNSTGEEVEWFEAASERMRAVLRKALTGEGARELAMTNQNKPIPAGGTLALVQADYDYAVRGQPRGYAPLPAWGSLNIEMRQAFISVYLQVAIDAARAARQ